VSSDLTDKREVETVAGEEVAGSDSSDERGVISNVGASAELSTSCVGLGTGMTVKPPCLSLTSRRERSLGEEEVDKGSNTVRPRTDGPVINQREIGPAETVHAKRANSKKS
jgi:hypothetical protein